MRQKAGEKRLAFHVKRLRRFLGAYTFPYVWPSGGACKVCFFVWGGEGVEIYFFLRPKKPGKRREFFFCASGRAEKGCRSALTLQ